MVSEIFSELKGKKVLVTGATGFLGQNLVKRLVKEGVTTSAVGRSDFALDGLHYCRLDLCDRQEVERVFTEISPDIVFHLATSMKRSEEDREEVFRVNVDGFRNVLDFTSCRIVFVSSGEVYGGLNNQVPFYESMPVKGVSVYSESKVEAEKMVKGNSRVVVLRPSIIYGPGLDLSSSMFIPSVVRAFLSDKDFESTGGKQTRDFVYVDDVVEACLLVAVSDVGGQVFNVGVGLEYTLGSVARLIFGNSSRLKLGVRLYRDKEIWRYYLDNNKLRELGWIPKVSLEMGIKRYIDWARREVL